MQVILIFLLVVIARTEPAECNTIPNRVTFFSSSSFPVVSFSLDALNQCIQQKQRY